MRTSFPLVASQIFTELSTLPLAICLPSGDHATANTHSECPLSVRSSFPLAASQIFTELSSLPLAMCLPSGDHTTEFTLPECPSWKCNSGSECSVLFFTVPIFSATMPRAVSCAGQSAVAQNTAQASTARIAFIFAMVAKMFIIGLLEIGLFAAVLFLYNQGGCAFICEEIF